MLKFSFEIQQMATKPYLWATHFFLNYISSAFAYFNVNMLWYGSKCELKFFKKDTRLLVINSLNIFLVF